MSDNNQLLYRKCCWRSRRGLLELDLLLVPYIQRGLTDYDRLLVRYSQLIEEDDHDILDWIKYSQKVPEHYQGVIDHIRSFHLLEK